MIVSVSLISSPIHLLVRCISIANQPANFAPHSELIQIQKSNRIQISSGERHVAHNADNGELEMRRESASPPHEGIPHFNLEVLKNVCPFSFSEVIPVQFEAHEKLFARAQVTREYKG